MTQPHSNAPGHSKCPREAPDAPKPCTPCSHPVTQKKHIKAMVQRRQKLKYSEGTKKRHITGHCLLYSRKYFIYWSFKMNHSNSRCILDVVCAAFPYTWSCGGWQASLCIFRDFSSFSSPAQTCPTDRASTSASSCSSRRRVRWPGFSRSSTGSSSSPSSLGPS